MSVGSYILIQQVNKGLIKWCIHGVPASYNCWTEGISVFCVWLSGYRQRACWFLIGKLVVGGRSTGDCHSCRDSSSSCRRALPVPAVPLKPGAGFKTVSASILRARPGSLCLILQTFVRVFSVTELIGLQVVSSGKKQVEKYILTGPYLRGKVWKHNLFLL